MKTYIYVQDGSDKRGYNVNIRAYRVVNNLPKIIGNQDWNTASWPGASGAASQLIAKVEGYKTDGYYILRKDVQIRQV